MSVLLVLLVPMVATPYSVGQVVTTIDLLGKPVVVHVGNDEAVMTAVRTLQENLPGVRTVSLSSAEELNNLVLSNVAVFLVGHGGYQGLGTLEKVVLPWILLNSLQQRYPTAKVYVIACDAQQYLQVWEVVSTRVAFAPNGKIDAEIGALEALVQFALDFTLTTVALLLASRLFTIMLTKSPSKYLLLPCLETCGGSTSSGQTSSTSGSISNPSNDDREGFLKNFSTQERIYWIAQFMIAGAIALLGLGIASTAGEVAGTAVAYVLYYTVLSSMSLMFADIVWWMVGLMTTEAFLLSLINNFFSIIGSGLASFIKLINDYLIKVTPWWDFWKIAKLITLIVSVLGTLASWIVGTAGSAGTATLLAIISTFGWLGANLIDDITDEDPIVG